MLVLREYFGIRSNFSIIQNLDYHVIFIRQKILCITFVRSLFGSFCLHPPCWGQLRGCQLPCQVARYDQDTKFIVPIHRMMQLQFLFSTSTAHTSSQCHERFIWDIHFLFPIMLLVSKTEQNWIYFSLTRR